MESKKETYNKPTILVHEFEMEKGYSTSINTPNEILVGDYETLGTFEEDGATHYVAGRVNRSSGEDKGWF